MSKFNTYIRQINDIAAEAFKEYTAVETAYKNAESKKMGRKDILKIDQLIDVNLDAIGYVDPGITVNIIKNGKLVKRTHIDPPEEIVDIIKCKNPRCITTTEQELQHVFKLTDRENGVYR